MTLTPRRAPLSRPPSHCDASSSAPLLSAVPPKKLAVPAPPREYGPAVVSKAISQTATWNAASLTLVSTAPATE